MTTAREQAREECYSSWRDNPEKYASAGMHALTDLCADAASNAWEPLLRELLQAGDHMARFSDQHDSVHEWDVVARRMKGLLNDNRS